MQDFVVPEPAGFHHHVTIEELDGQVTERGSHRRTVGAIVGLLGAGLILSASTDSVGARPAIGQVPAPEIEISADPTVHGSSPSISGSGQFVAFAGVPRPTDPDGAPDGRTSTVFLLDRQFGTTTEITTVPPGTRAGNSVNPTISGDGCVLVVTTELQLDVFRDDDGGDRWDVYRTTLPQCGGQPNDWELVSSDPATGSLARDDVPPTQRTAVSRSGALVAFVHPADEFVGHEGITSISLVDLTVPYDSPDRIRRVVGMPLDVPDTPYTHAGIDQPAISADGRFVAFRSDTTADEPAPQWADGPEAGGPATRQVYVWDREEADPLTAVRLVSALPNGEPTAAGATDVALSSDGHVVAFASADVGLVPAVFPACRDACPSQVYRLDRDTDGNGYLDEVGRTTLELLSATAGTTPPQAGNGPSSQPTLNADGRLVAFVSRATNIQPIQPQFGGGGGDGDLLIAGGGTLRRATVSADGIRPTIGAHGHPQLSDSGRALAFDTLVAAEFAGNDEAPGGRNTVTLEMPVTLSMADADLGSTLVGLPSNEMFVAVINNGPASFVPSEVTVSDRRFTINPATSTCRFGLPIPAGGDCTVAVTFTPSSPGGVSATLTVSEQGFNAMSVSSTVTGNGGEPALLADPGGFDIGAVDFGSVSVESLFDVENISLMPTSVARVEITGANAAEFTVASNNCANRPLNPRANCSVGITFRPAGAGRRTAVVVVSTPTGQTTSVVVSGDGVYRPTLEVLDDEVIAGEEMLVAGTGYPPNTTVTIVFGDRPSDTVTADTNAEGGFLLFVPVASDEIGGSRSLVVQSAAGVAATAPVEVVANDVPMIGLPGFGLGG